MSLMHLHALCVDCGKVEQVENPRPGYYYQLVHILWPKGHAVEARVPGAVLPHFGSG